MSAVVITDGQSVRKDPADSKVYTFDWDRDNLAAGVSISTSTFTISAYRPNAADSALTKDSEALLTAAEATAAVEHPVELDNRVTRVRLIGGTLGQEYGVANRIVTTETPNQIKERTFKVLIVNL